MREWRGDWIECELSRDVSSGTASDRGRLECQGHSPPLRAVRYSIAACASKLSADRWAPLQAATHHLAQGPGHRVGGAAGTGPAHGL